MKKSIDLYRWTSVSVNLKLNINWSAPKQAFAIS
jgi:hypothetical protein